MRRSYLYEAAGVLLTGVKKWSALKAKGMRIAMVGDERYGSPSSFERRSLLVRLTPDTRRHSGRTATPAWWSRPKGSSSLPLGPRRIESGLAAVDL